MLFLDLILFILEILFSTFTLAFLFGSIWITGKNFDRILKLLAFGVFLLISANILSFLKSLDVQIPDIVVKILRTWMSFMFLLAAVYLYAVVKTKSESKS